MRVIDFEIICVSCLLKSERQCVSCVRSYLMEVQTKSRTKVPKYCNAKASHKKELMFVVHIVCFTVLQLVFSFKESKKGTFLFFKHLVNIFRTQKCPVKIHYENILQILSETVFSIRNETTLSYSYGFLKIALFEKMPIFSVNNRIPFLLSRILGLQIIAYLVFCYDQ